MDRNPEKAPQDAFRAHFCCGEGETTIVPFFSSLLKNTPDTSVPGLVYRENGLVKVNPRPELLKDLATAIGSGMYIIPSSIHEVILVPSVNCDDGESIRQMIREVNDTQVEMEEILSYSLYYYDKEEDKVLIA